MAEDERLREALLELQMLRDREARSLEDTKTLLDCLEAYTSAQSPGDALASIFLSLRQKIGAVHGLILTRTDDGGAEIAACDDPDVISLRVVAPVDLFARPAQRLGFGNVGRLGRPH